MAKKAEITVLDGNLNNTYLVQKSEPLLLMRTVPFELGELKILDTYLSRINSHDEKCRTVTFTKAEYEQLMGLTDTRPQTLKKYIKSMLQKVVDIPTEKGYKLFSLFTCATCEKDEYEQWTITLSCSEDAKQLFFGIEQLGYLQYELKNILSLTSKYSFLLYLYLRKERYRSDWVIPLDELREQRLDIKNNETYLNFKYFKRDVIDKAVAEVNEKTDIKFTYITVKKGRRVTGIRFQIIKELNAIDEDQLTFDDIPNYEYDVNDKLGLLAEAVHNEFSPTQMNEIFETICLLQLPDSEDLGTDIARYHYLAKKYAKLNSSDERNKLKGKPIKNRFNYFLKLIQGDIDNNDSTEKENVSDQSYDIDKFDQFAVTFSKNTKKNK